MDDIVVLGTTKEELKKNTLEILEILKENQLYLKGSVGIVQNLEESDHYQACTGTTTIEGTLPCRNRRLRICHRGSTVSGTGREMAPHCIHVEDYVCGGTEL